MKKIFIMLYITVILFGITGCNGNKEIIVDSKNYNKDIYKLTLDEFKNDTSRETKDLIILANKYSDELEETKKKAQKELEDIKNQYTLAGSNFNEMLKQQNYTIDDYYNHILFSCMLDIAAEEYTKTLITEEEINKFYDENSFEMITVKHILISASENQEALNKANEVITKLNNGESWKTLVEDYSDDQATISNEGLIEFYYGQLLEEFEEAVKKLKVGEYTTSPVKTAYGYHIIYKVSQEESSLNEVREDIIKKLVSEKISSEDKLKLTALENIRKETYDHLDDKGIKEVLMDTKFYTIYDAEGKSVYSKCKNDKCPKKEYTQLDLSKINIIELNKILYKVGVENLNYWLSTELTEYSGEYNGDGITGKISLSLKNDGTCYYINQYNDTKGLTKIEGNCTYNTWTNLLTLNGTLNYSYIPNDEYKNQLLQKNTNNNYSFDFTIEDSGKYIKNDDGTFYNTTYNRYRESGEQVLVSAADYTKIYSIEGKELFSTCDETEKSCPKSIDLTKYTIE